MESIMTIKTLSAIAIVSAALSGPVFAQDPGLDGTSYQKPAHVQRHFRGAYNRAPVNESFYAGPRASEGWSFENPGIDRSRPGGLDPDLNPAAN
jgi:hypothetical protein